MSAPGAAEPAGTTAATATTRHPRRNRTGAIAASIGLLLAAIAAGLAWASGEDSFRLSALNNAAGQGSRWATNALFDGLVIAALIVGVISLAALLMMFPIWEGLPLVGALAALGIAIGVLVFWPLWTEPQAIGFAPARDAYEDPEMWDADAWRKYREPWQVPAIWAAAGAAFFGLWLAARAIGRKVIARRRAARASKS